MGCWSPASAGSERMDCQHHPLHKFEMGAGSASLHSVAGQSSRLPVGGRPYRGSMVATGRVHEGGRIALARHYCDAEASRSPRSPGASDAQKPRARPTSTTRLMLTKDLQIAHALRRPRRDVRRVRRLPGHKAAPGLSRAERTPQSRGGASPTPDPGQSPSVRQGARPVCYGTRHTGDAPVWHAQADSAACRLVSTAAPDARASLALEARASRATAGGVGSAHSPVGFFSS